MHHIHWGFRYEAHHILLYILGIYLDILYNNIGVVLFYTNGNSFLFKHLSFGLNNNYFMVCFFKGVFRHYIKQMKIQITILVNNVCNTLFVGN